MGIKETMTLKEFKDKINQIDPKFDDLEVGIPDGIHHYWGVVYTKITNITKAFESLDGPNKQRPVECIIIR